jgi:hypothetical protein
MDSREQAILKTLLYSSLFDYPLKREEIYNFLIGLKIDKKEFNKILKSSKLPIKSSKGYFFLSGKDDFLEKRQKREKVSLEKLRKAEKIIKTIGMVPTIKLIGISGTLAMKNSEKEDDIDLFIVAEKNLVWLTRFLIVPLLILKGVYRTRGSKNNADKICLNLLLGEEKMRFEDMNLFTAHEIAQLVPVLEKRGTYRKFLEENKWIKDFLPNTSINKKIKFKKQDSIYENVFMILAKILFLEKISRSLQLFYMKGHITKERLENSFIGLHPLDYKSKVLRDFQKGLRKSRLL